VKARARSWHAHIIKQTDRQTKDNHTFVVQLDMVMVPLILLLILHGVVIVGLWSVGE
jgi:hypothetical protein